jgi:N-acetyl sugar amidotransferase
MALIGKICSLGIWNESVPEITFDEEGVSNFAHLQQKLMETYPRGLKGEEEWMEIVEQAKNRQKGKYNCIVGVSGGVDSSYLLYLVKEKYGLTPLAVTLDNGWNTNIAVENIKKITQALNIDLETYVINYEEVTDLLRSYMYAGMPWIDMASDIAIKSVMYKYAIAEKVKYVFRGNDFRSEGKQPRPWTYGDSRQLNYIHKKFGRIHKLKTFPYLPYRRIIYAGFIKGIKEVRPYYYLDYKKSEAAKFLQEKFGWQYYGGHHHENNFTKYAMSVWLPDKFGIDKRIINLSAQVLSGSITREDALKQISSPALNSKEKSELTDYIIKKLDLTREEYEKILAASGRSYKDYPNYEKLLYTLLKFMKPFIKLVYKQMPMTFIEMEMNNR